MHRQTQNILVKSIEHVSFTKIINAMSFVRFVNLRVPAGSAKPGPAIGQALGPLGMI
jgi:hypothetical protein